MLTLPEAIDAREEAWERLVNESRRTRNRYAPEWYITRHYLIGARDFELIDYSRGEVRPVYPTETDGIPFRFEQVLRIYNNEVSRLERLDIKPLVSRGAMGLDRLRQTSASQVILDHIYTHWKPDAIKKAICQLVVMYGTLGVRVFERPEAERTKDQPATAIGVEVILPWELLPLPGYIRHDSEVKAIARQRWVSYEWFKKQFANPKDDWPDADDPDLRARQLPAGSNVSTSSGSVIEGHGSRFSVSSLTKNVRDMFTKRKIHDDMEWFVEVTEIWNPYDNGRLESYNVRIGRKEVYRKVYTKGKEPMMPVAVITNHGGTGFFGKSFVYSLIPVESHIEPALHNMIRNLADADQFGITLIPESMGVNLNDLQQSGAGPKVAPYLDDPLDKNPSNRVIQITPIAVQGAYSGLLATLLGLNDKLAQQPESMTQGKAPGRVDSTPALDQLFKQSNMPLGAVASSISEGMGVIYKAMLHIAGSWNSIVINLNSLTDDSVIGIQFDPKTGQLKISDNKLPRPETLDVGIASRDPQDIEAVKQELLGLHQAQLISREDLIIQAQLNNIDLHIDGGTIWQNYRMAMMRNVILFNDGKTPGNLPEKMKVSENDNPNIHLMVVQRLMASPEFALAEPAVQEAFGDLLERIKGNSANLPEGMPYMEDEAEMAGQNPMDMMQGMQGMPNVGMPGQ